MFFGIVIEINELEYFAPLTSWKPGYSNQTRLSGFVPIYDDINKKYLAAIKIYFMFPVPKGEYKEITFDRLEELRSFDNETEKYKYWNFLNKELSLLNEEDAKAQAKNIYNLYLKNGYNKGVHGIDYSIAEEKAKEYNKK